MHIARTSDNEDVWVPLMLSSRFLLNCSRVRKRQLEVGLAVGMKLAPSIMIRGWEEAILKGYTDVLEEEMKYIGLTTMKYMGLTAMISSITLGKSILFVMLRDGTSESFSVAEWYVGRCIETYLRNAKAKVSKRTMGHLFSIMELLMRKGWSPAKVEAFIESVGVAAKNNELYKWNNTRLWGEKYYGFFRALIDMGDNDLLVKVLGSDMHTRYRRMRVFDLPLVEYCIETGRYDALYILNSLYPGELCTLSAVSVVVGKKGPIISNLEWLFEEYPHIQRQLAGDTEYGKIEAESLARMGIDANSLRYLFQKGYMVEADAGAFVRCGMIDCIRVMREFFPNLRYQASYDWSAKAFWALLECPGEITRVWDVYQPTHETAIALRNLLFVVWEYGDEMVQHGSVDTNKYKELEGIADPYLFAEKVIRTFRKIFSFSGVLRFASHFRVEHIKFLIKCGIEIPACFERHRKGTWSKIQWKARRYIRENSVGDPENCRCTLHS